MATKQQGGCLTAIFGILGGSADNTSSQEYAPLPYGRRKYLLSQAEQSFYHTLAEILNSHYIICPKVRISDILYVDKKKATKTYTFLNKITSKHIDFLLCDPRSVTPLLAIELDDKSHEREDRQKRDFFIDKAFADAGMPLVHIKAQRGYNRDELIATLRPYLAGNSAT